MQYYIAQGLVLAVFFFQAEDGIRDHCVTGVQTWLFRSIFREVPVIYAGSYDGYLSKYTHKTDQEQDISPWPDNPMGSGANSAKYRFQWTYPILVSKFDSKVIYVTANKVFKSTNEGMSWQIISPDLTRNDTAKLGSSGGPITKDNTSVEYYGTIFTFAESPLRKGEIGRASCRERV